MKCPKCSAPIHPIQRRCNNCATRVAFCKSCKTISLLEKQYCNTCKKPFPSTKNFQQLETEYYQKYQEVAIRFVCLCGKTISVSMSQAGKTGKCPKCGYKLLVPTPNAKKSSTKLEPIQVPPVPQKKTLEKKNSEKKEPELSEKPLFSDDIFSKASPENNPSEPMQLSFSDDIFAAIPTKKEDPDAPGEFSIPISPSGSKKSSKISKPKIELRPPEKPSTKGSKRFP